MIMSPYPTQLGLNGITSHKIKTPVIFLVLAPMVSLFTFAKGSSEIQNYIHFCYFATGSDTINIHPSLSHN
jgi:hypothetical protein